MSQATVDQNTLDAITAYTIQMEVSLNSHRNAIQALFVEHCSQCSALIAMQQQYITERESLHNKQMQDLIDSFQLRYQVLEAQLTAEQMQNFRHYMTTMQGDLDLWSSVEDALVDANPISTASIEDFLNGSTVEETPALVLSGDAE